ncbi:hypothetical protein E2C01_076885 [Portunus trituberculatus]|uniref:Uncharacterized protein n=1 Tax=Portunus trituberculatus TaxID=210409 RepID=A0A5B7IIV8_PORTR|nr:hypothetical protein [Portunus trituberculatus]
MNNYKSRQHHIRHHHIYITLAVAECRSNKWRCSAAGVPHDRHTLGKKRKNLMRVWVGKKCNVYFT